MIRAYLAAVGLAALVLALPLPSAAALDPAAPMITSSTPASPSNDNSPVLSGTAVPLATIKVYTDSACSGAVAATGLADLLGGGFQIGVTVLDDSATTFYATATDLTGTSACSDGFTYVEDSTDPPPPQLTVHPDPTSNDTNPTFGFTDDEAGVTFMCRLISGPFPPCTSPQSYPVTNGPYTFYVKAVDAAGNESSSTQFDWIVDTNAPPPPTIVEGPTNPSDSLIAHFAFNGEAGALFRCQLDGGGLFACPNPVNLQVIDGTHTLVVRAVDAAGNVSAPSTPYTWTVDTVHPLVSLTEKPPLVTNLTTATFGFSANKPASSYQCALDGAAFAPCTSPRVYSGLADGSHTFAVRAIWLALVGPPTRYTWRVDTVSPQTALASTPPPASTSASAGFTFTSNEVGSTFACSLGAAGFTPCASPKSYSNLRDGTYTFRVQAVDAAGNVDPSPASYTWTIKGGGGTGDHTPPRNPSRLRRNVGYGQLQLRWRNPSDPDFDHVEVYVSTSPKSQPRTLVYKGRSQTYKNKRFKNGLYYRYRVASVDHLKNGSTGATTTVPPSALLRSPRNGAVVHSPPVLRWASVRKARFYNVQLYYRGQKVLSAWPTKPRRALVRRWTYSGRGLTLRKGTYLWYVWPGFGTKSKTRYGQLLGQGVFKVR
jgi:hypothetical protein